MRLKGLSEKGVQQVARTIKGQDTYEWQYGTEIDPLATAVHNDLNDAEAYAKELVSDVDAILYSATSPHQEVKDWVHEVRWAAEKAQALVNLLEMVADTLEEGSQ